MFGKVCPAECFAEYFIRWSGPSNPRPHYISKLLQFCQEIGWELLGWLLCKVRLHLRVSNRRWSCQAGSRIFLYISNDSFYPSFCLPRVELVSCATGLFILSPWPLTQRKYGFFLNHLLKVFSVDHRFHCNKIQFCQITSKVFFPPNNLMVTYSNHQN